MIRKLKIIAKGRECEAYCDRGERHVENDLLLVNVYAGGLKGLKHVTVVVGGL